MKNMDKGLTIPNRVLIVRLKIAQMSHHLPAQFVCPSPKVWDFNEKGFVVLKNYFKKLRIINVVIDQTENW